MILVIFSFALGKNIMYECSLRQDKPKILIITLIIIDDFYGKGSHIKKK